jgi:hypothetical protein
VATATTVRVRDGRMETLDSPFADPGRGVRLDRNPADPELGQ